MQSSLSLRRQGLQGSSISCTIWTPIKRKLTVCPDGAGIRVHCLLAGHIMFSRSVTFLLMSLYGTPKQFLPL